MLSAAGVARSKVAAAVCGERTLRDADTALGRSSCAAWGSRPPLQGSSTSLSAIRSLLKPKAAHWQHSSTRCAEISIGRPTKARQQSYASAQCHWFLLPCLVSASSPGSRERSQDRPLAAPSEQACNCRCRFAYCPLAFLVSCVSGFRQTGKLSDSFLGPERRSPSVPAESQMPVPSPWVEGALTLRGRH